MTRALTKIRIEGDAVVVEPAGALMKFFACRRRVVVPLTLITDVAVADDPIGLLRGVRAPGTSIDRVLQAGTFRWHRRKTFAVLGRAKSALTMEVRSFRFDRVVVQVEDPHRSASQIASAVRNVEH